ncbi:MAG: tetrahydrofolate dehydrogenase/cyclohydrolase catalytic domain-containing protein, partial [Candidatus Saccharimonadales bacterium]
ELYMKLKKQYGMDILVNVDIHRIKQKEVEELLNKLNHDDNVHGIIVQLPLADPSQTDKIVREISPDKDVDGLVEHSKFEPATPMAILWLLSGYNVDMTNKVVVLVGRGKLVGAPLENMLRASGIIPSVVVKETPNGPDEIKKGDIVITATGVAGLIKPDMLKEGAVVVDAGVASEGAKTVGDVAQEVYEQREDLIITPRKGGVGPLTVCALFENVILSAQRRAEK